MANDQKSPNNYFESSIIIEPCFRSLVLSASSSDVSTSSSMFLRVLSRYR